MTVPNSILFVCLGNICRSPSAEAVMRQKISERGLDIHIDSAGTANYHSGEMPDSRAIQIGKSLGYNLTNLTARQLSLDDFDKFDIIFAMDKQNLQDIKRLASQKSTAFRAKIQAFDSVCVKDPYYGDEQDFDAMYWHIQKVCDKWLDDWQSFSL